MARPRTRRRDDRVERKPKKRISILDSEQIVYVDYKDVNLLRRFMSERAKIRARRVTGNNQQQQAAVAQAIKIAREMALLPYSVRQVTQRSKGRRDRDRDRGDRDDRGDRGDRDRPLSEAPAGPTDEQAADAEGAEFEVTEATEAEAGANGAEAGGNEDGA